MQFQLRVMRPQAVPEVIRLEASSNDDARRLAEQQGFTVLRIIQQGVKHRKSAFPLLLFCQELRVLIEAGLTLTESLDTLIQKEPNADTRSTISTVLASLRNGRQLSDALSAIPACFPGLFVASVKACETTGNLPEGLERFSLYLEQIDILQKKIISASIYPALVLAFGGLVLLFLLGYVVPRFSQIYESRDMELSFASEVLLTIGQTVEHHGPLILMLTLVVIAAVIGLFSQAIVRAKIGLFITRLPKIGERGRIYHLSRLYHLTTPVAAQLFRVGEKSGRLDVMMERAASFHEQEMLRWVDAFTKVFEPLLMAAIGVVIGLIVLLMYLPIFELAGGIQ